ncbi:hypothetical protein [Cypionkella psychrotolerans]|uniref:hypothetical protein n=1 Tax=Cypionkella psychrotolerans TaxID=1678131 RepID=UPI0012E20185|nr:hypothetical protein [Cypionkella psychrotolerans]
MFKVATLLAIVFVIVRAVQSYPSIQDVFYSADNDDMMRLLSVRDWLNGQSWFDMTQYRVLPPEGIPMHWSRFVDLGIGGIISLFHLFMPMNQAENLTLVVWPSMLLVAMVLLTGCGTRKILGPNAASVAILSTMVWLPLFNRHFAPGHIDHHNVQILITTILAYALIWPVRPLRAGLIGGAAAACSLVVGLEMLVLIVLAGAMLTIRASFYRPGAGRKLIGFCSSLLVVSILGFLGQTAPSQWFVPYCDAMATPVLSLIMISAAACMIPIAAARWLPSPWARLAATAAIVLGSQWLFWSLIQPCLAGPYGALPLEVQNLIRNNISEAQGAVAVFLLRPFQFYAEVAPQIVAVLFAISLWLLRFRKASGAESEAVVQIIALVFVGVVGMFYQVRMLVLTAAGFPFLVGYVINCLIQGWQQNPSPRRAVLIGVSAAVILMPADIYWNGRAIWRMVTGLDADGAQVNKMLDDRCRTKAVMQELDQLPKARILTRLNFGAPLISLTHHYALTAPYHRSADAFWNGEFAFYTEANMEKALAKTGANYVVLCRDASYGTYEAVPKALLAGKTVAGLRQIDFPGKDFAVFEVIANPTAASQ